MRHYKISAVIPVFNTEQYLRGCLDSLMSQSVALDEILLCDDGSTDGSARICREYEEKCPYIKYFRQENKGAGAARNLGLSNCNGDYVVFIDSDDLVERDYARRIREEIDKREIDVFYFAGSVVYDGGNVKPNNVYKRKMDKCGHLLAGYEYLTMSFESLDPYVNPVFQCVKMDLINGGEIRFQETCTYNDNLFSIKVAMLAKSVYCLDEALYINRSRPNSLQSSGMTAQRYGDRCQVSAAVIRTIRDFKRDYDSDFLIHFVESQILTVINIRSNNFAGLLDKDILLFEIELIEVFLDLWLEDFVKYSELDIPTVFFLLKFGDYMQVILHDMDNPSEFRKYLPYINEYRRQYRTAKESIDNYMLDKLKKCVDLGNPAKEVVIYGIGKRMREMLDAYDDVYGKIKCHLIYAVSDEEVNAEMKANGNIIPISTIPPITDVIIVASGIYKLEMLQQLRKVVPWFPKEKVICPYNDRYDISFYDWRSFYNRP